MVQIKQDYALSSSLPKKNICDHDAPRPSSVQAQWGSWRHGTEREEPAREPKVEKKGSNSIMRGGGNNKPLPHLIIIVGVDGCGSAIVTGGGELGVLCTAYDATCIHPSTSSTTSGSAALWDDFTRHRRGKTPEWGAAGRHRQCRRRRRNRFQSAVPSLSQLQRQV